MGQIGLTLGPAQGSPGVAIECPPFISLSLTVPEQPSEPSSKLRKRQDRAGLTGIGAGKQRPRGKVQLHTEVERVLGEVILESLKSAGTPPCVFSVRSLSETSGTLRT